MDLAENDMLYQQSKPLKQDQEIYHQLITTTAQRYYGDHIKMGTLILEHVKNYSFIHGTGTLSNGKVVIIYFFTDIQTGMMFASSLGGATDFFRLSVFVDKGNKLSEKTIIPTGLSKASH
jgi:hypothetical protein